MNVLFVALAPLIAIAAMVHGVDFLMDMDAVTMTAKFVRP